MRRIAASKAREAIADILNRVSVKGSRIVLHRHGKDVAAIVPILDLKRLEAFEELYFTRSADRPRFATPPTVSLVRERTAPLLRAYGVTRAAVFGSVARGDATQDSDVDLVVDLQPGQSILDLAALKLDIEEVLGRRTDVVTFDSLGSEIRQRVASEGVDIL